jgi:hypothetical protein
MAFYPLHLISPAPSPTSEFSVDVETIYHAIGNDIIPFEAFKYALMGFNNLQAKDSLAYDTLLTVIDYSLPSTEERLYIIDLKNRKLVKKSLVAHGMATGSLFAKSFSNCPRSHQSSLGFYRTESTYIGKHGYSLRMAGLEKGINDNARERAIVFHGAEYVSTDFIKKYGRLGRSFGCPALPPDENQSIIDLIKESTCVFMYFPDIEYLNRSKILNPPVTQPSNQQ